MQVNAFYNIYDYSSLSWKVSRTSTIQPPVNQLYALSKFLGETMQINKFYSMYEYSLLMEEPQLSGPLY